MCSFRKHVASYVAKTYCLTHNRDCNCELHIVIVPALEYFIANKSETDEVQLNFMWEIKYNGGYTINNLAIQYQDVQNVLEGKPD